MAYTIVAGEDGIVEAVFSGPMTFEEAEALREESAELMRARGLLATLVDMRETLVDSPGTFDIFEFNASHYEVYPVGTRLAVVIPPAPELQEDAQFAETVARNRGVLMRIFVDRDAAVEWLRTSKRVVR